MNLWLVTVEPGKNGGTMRYFDSIWAIESHANERREQLRDELKRSGFALAPESGNYSDRWTVTITVARCLDAEIPEKIPEETGRRDDLYLPNAIETLVVDPAT